MATKQQAKRDNGTKSEQLKIDKRKTEATGQKHRGDRWRQGNRFFKVFWSLGNFVRIF